ncbi:MAG: hypothetical protein AVDCRST_MAG19-2040, partial [uncultured Thermomicrobiales bacterium]
GRKGRHPAGRSPPRPRSHESCSAIGRGSIRTPTCESSESSSRLRQTPASQHRSNASDRRPRIARGRQPSGSSARTCAALEMRSTTRLPSNRGADGHRAGTPREPTGEEAL